MTLRNTDTNRALICALEQSDLAFVLADELDRVTFINRAAARLWGLDPAKVIGMALAQAQPGLVGEAGAKAWRMRVDAGPGEPKWADVSVTDIDVHGRHFRLTTARDVSAELARDERIQMLLKAFNHTDRPMVILDADRRMVCVNRALADLTGYTESELLGNRPGPMLAQPALNEEQWRYHAAKPWGREALCIEAKIRSRAGLDIWVRISSSPIAAADDDGPMRGYSLDVLQDITEERHLRDLERDVLQSLTSNLSFTEQGNLLCQRVREVAPDIQPSILLVDHKRRLRPWATQQIPAAYVATIDGLPVGEGVGSCGTSAARGAPVVCRDIAHDPLWGPYAATALEHGLRACWSYPIKRRDGTVAGTFAFYADRPRGPRAFHERIIDVCTHLCMLAIEREESRLRMEHLALFDRLTGLPNREGLQLHVKEVLSNEAASPVAFLLLGLDGFRDVNDGLGHSVGDEVLLEMAARLQLQLNPGQIIGRPEGDQFAIIAPGCDAHGALRLAERLQSVIARPIRVGDHPLQMSACLGITLHTKGGSADALLEGAKKAMYDAKGRGAGTRSFFSPDMNRQAHERLMLGAALRRVLAEEGLHLMYQPQVRMNDGQLYGVEALARWTDPELGMIAPSRFIGLAEEIGEIETLGRWALREACRQMTAWRASGVAVPVVSVNLSPLSFRDPQLPAFIGSLLREYHLQGENLTVEITESATLALTPDMLSGIHGIRALGVGLSVDDFGTGFSSLSNLINLPVTEVKIDRSFVDQCAQEVRLKSLVTAVIGIGKSLDLTVVAEGVETHEQRDLLRRWQCPVAQGYVFARPLAPAQMGDYLAALRETSAGGMVRSTTSHAWALKHLLGGPDQGVPWPMSRTELNQFIDALPFAVSWASLPGGTIRHGNPAFDELFGYPPDHFPSADQFIDDVYVHQKHRKLLRKQWRHFALLPGATGITAIPEFEIDVVCGDGQVRTVTHCGLMLHELRVGVAFYRDVSDYKRTSQELKKQALLDPLTGLANRRGLQQAWRAALRRDKSAQRALLMVDLDDFKSVNDSYGHDGGDIVLCAVARKLKTVVRDSDVVCRLGGDEFVLLLNHPGTTAHVEAICERLLASLTEPVDVGGVKVTVTASVGVCTYPDHAADKRELLQRADMALYRVKKTGKQGWAWWSDVNEATADSTVAVAADPQVSSRTRPVP